MPTESICNRTILQADVKLLAHLLTSLTACRRTVRIGMTAVVLCCSYMQRCAHELRDRRAADMLANISALLTSSAGTAVNKLSLARV